MNNQDGATKIKSLRPHFLTRRTMEKGSDCPCLSLRQNRLSVLAARDAVLIADRFILDTDKLLLLVELRHLRN
jgi:hypothetical protein